MLYVSCGLETWSLPKVYCFILWIHFALWLRAWRLVMAHGWDLWRLSAFWDLLWTVILVQPVSLGFPGGSDGKESTCNSGNPGSIPGLGRSPGEGNGSPLQYSRLENSMDRGTWWATRDHKELDTTEWLTRHFTWWMILTDFQCETRLVFLG